jgi:4-hydroxythreonine-4-phosphate dehydrogenase
MSQECRVERRPTIAITMGDPCGIGPEVVAKALAVPEVWGWCRPLVVGSADVMREAVALVRAPLRVIAVDGPPEVAPEPGVLPVLDPGNLNPRHITLGRVSATAGRASMEWVVQAAKLCLSGAAAAMVTAPVNKEACDLAGYKEIGHMEVLQGLTGAPEVATMLIAGGLRVVHLTTHRSLRRACDAVTRENVLAKLLLTHHAFQGWGIPQPRIGVAALNPHASDGGLLGDEEAQAIAPAVEEARRRGVQATGPVPADVVFHQAIERKYDVALAMYHDQGHIPIKVHDFHRSVSVNLGLPLIRTSVDHGTAFDIAGKGVANPTSMLEALRLAVALASGDGLTRLPPVPATHR